MWTDNSRSSLQLLPVVTSKDRVAQLFDETASTVYLLRNSSAKPWRPSQNQLGSIDNWSQEHMRLFNLPSEPIFMSIGIPSRTFPLVPSTSVSMFINDVAAIKSREGNPGDIFKAIDWTIELSGAVARCARTSPQQKACIATYLDGFSCCIELL